MRKLHAAVTGLVIALAVVPWLIWWGSLPPEMASHWSGLNPTPDGHMSKGVSFAVIAGLAVILAIASFASSRHASALPRPGSTGPGLALSAGVVTGLSLALVFIHRDVTSWEEARLSYLWLLGAGGIGVVFALVSAGVVPKANEVVAPRPAMAVRASESVAWAGGAHARWAMVLAVVIVGFGVVLIPNASPVSGVITIGAGLAVAWCSSIHVVVGKAGVRVRGAFGWPSVLVPLERIESAETLDVGPAQWGGWGYRGSLRLFRRAAFVVRRGEGIKLNLLRKKSGVNVILVLTVDDADAGAAVVNGLIHANL